MKLQKSLVHIGTASLFVGLIAFSCTKALTDLNPLTSTEIAQVTNADNQDAIADKTDQDIDKTLDALQNNGFNAANTETSLKSDNSIQITVDKDDSTTFPKVVKIIFNNYKDSAGNESFIKNGEIDIVVTAPSTNKKLTVKTQTFLNFSVATDSSTVTISGVRAVKRQEFSSYFESATQINTTITDSIIGALNYSVTSGTDSYTFTRIIAKKRTAMRHYVKLAPFKWKDNIGKDTLEYTGTVGGVNEKGFIYTKTFTNAAPLKVIFSNTKSVIISGTMEYSVTNESKETSLYTLKFSESTKNSGKTQIIIINDKTGKTYTLDRKLNRKYRKW